MTQLMPIREDLYTTLDSLSLGFARRDDVAAWATALIENDELRVHDQLAWNVLIRIGGVDLPASDRDYLYTAEDFKAWQLELIILQC